MGKLPSRYKRFSTCYTCQIFWRKHSFAQIVDFLHENDIDCEKKDYGAFSLENRPENGFDTIKPEPRLVLVYHNYCVTETDGNLILI